MFHVLVVEDDLKLRQLLCTVLIKNGYRVTGTMDGQQALAALEREYVDLMICDILMPNMDGCELTRSLREAGYTLPVLMVTACETFFDKQRGFLAGTDDYMVKPIDVNEMLLRVGALLRRAKIISERKIVCGSLTLNYDALTVSGDGLNELLPQKEFYLLYKLLAYAGKIFTRQQLMDEIWGLDSSSDARTVDVHINRLRERFRDNGNFDIITVRGLGYKAEKHNED
ncbi:MAG: heme response regulator HssR [Oscillospiraceae bacterium]|jgi:DNA-binding response OmpR family regulator|nr:heme response regulator HssR [Oscillospiraceae bacterium]